MQGNAGSQSRYEETAEQPSSEEEPGKRWRWRGIRVSVFWNFGIKIVRPKRIAAGRPTLVQGADSKTIARIQETSA